MSFEGLNILMRRAKQAICEKDCLSILDRASSGTLSLVDGAEPYAVPLNFVRCGKHIIFHSAKEGRKIEAVRKNPYACFSVIDSDLVRPEKFATDFRSVIVEGKIDFVSSADEKKMYLRELCKKYSPCVSSLAVEKEIELSISSVLILRLSIESISGKVGIYIMEKENGTG